MIPSISRIDHLAITTHDLPRFIEFYVTRLGATVEAEHELDGVVSVIQLALGAAMLNVHRAGHSHWLVAKHPTPGAADLCFRWEGPIETAVRALSDQGIEIIEGPVPRICSDMVPGLSVYFRDPDGNLIEFLTIQK